FELLGAPEHVIEPSHSLMVRCVSLQWMWMLLLSPGTHTSMSTSRKICRLGKLSPPGWPHVGLPNNSNDSERPGGGREYGPCMHQPTSAGVKFPGLIECRRLGLVRVAGRATSLSKVVAEDANG